MIRITGQVLKFYELKSDFLELKQLLAAGTFAKWKMIHSSRFVSVFVENPLVWILDGKKLNKGENVIAIIEKDVATEVEKMHEVAT